MPGSRLELAKQKAQKGVEKKAYQAARKAAEFLVEWGNSLPEEKEKEKEKKLGNPVPRRPLTKEQAKKVQEDEEKFKDSVDSVFLLAETGYFLHPHWFVKGTSFLFFRLVGSFAEVVREVMQEKAKPGEEKEGQPEPTRSLWAAVLSGLPKDEEALLSFCGSRGAASPEKAQSFLEGLLKSVPKKNWAMVLTELKPEDRPSVIHWLKRLKMYPLV